MVEDQVPNVVLQHAEAELKKANGKSDEQLTQQNLIAIIDHNFMHALMFYNLNKNLDFDFVIKINDIIKRTKIDFVIEKISHLVHETNLLF